MKRRADFRIELSVKHPSIKPSAISESLNLRPEFAWGVGDPVGNRLHKSTLWRGILVKASGAMKFDIALKSVLLVLSDRVEFFNLIMASGGEVSLTIRTFADPQDGKIAEIHLNAPFLEALTSLRIGVAVEVWMKAAEVANRPA